jgi:hypothetical protein
VVVEAGIWDWGSVRQRGPCPPANLEGQMKKIVALEALLLAGLLAFPCNLWLARQALAQRELPALEKKQQQELQQKRQEESEYLKQKEEKSQNTGKRLQDARKRQEDALKRQQEAERRLRKLEEKEE